MKLYNTVVLLLCTYIYIYRNKGGGGGVRGMKCILCVLCGCLVWCILYYMVPVIVMYFA